MAKLLTRAATVSVIDYGLVTGNPTAGTSTAICGRARSVSEDQTSNEIDQTAICDVVKQTLPDQADGTIQIEQFVEGDLFWRPLFGHWVRVIITPDDDADPFTVDGSVTTRGYRLAVGESQIETVTIKSVATAFPNPA